MGLEIKLNQKLSQSLVMTPQLQQAIKLLQLGRTEYLEVIERELMENPVLEDVREEGSTQSSAPETLVSDGSNSGADLELSSSAEPMIPGEMAEGKSDDQAKMEFQADLVSYLDLYAEAQGSNFGTARRYDGEDELPPIESTVSQREGLSSHLMWQLRTADLAAEEIEIALHVVGNLDRNGYLEVSAEELALECQVETGAVERVLSIIHTCDPIGVAARDLRECLLIQLDHLGMSETLTAKIVRDHLPKLESRKYDLIAREEKVPVAEVYEAVKQVQRLEPRPGRPFVDEEPVYITPDLYVKKLEDQWVVTLNESGMPRLRLSPRYRELLENGGASSGQDKEYLQDRIRSAAWLIKSVLQRQRTIHRVAESIMRFQHEFLDLGVGAMKPLVLRDVAQDVSMHESTVSRVTTNKFIHTPHGVFELKYFFSSGIRSNEGDVSSKSVKERIRQLISEESTAKPLSDQELVLILKGEGVDIARRTVAKYREMMNILSSSRRRKVF